MMPSPTGDVGMLHAHAPAYFWIKGKGPLDQRRPRFGATHATGRLGELPNSHGIGVSKGSKNP